MVDKECVEVVRRNLSLFKPQQRAALAVDRKDIYFAFVYQVGTKKKNKSYFFFNFQCTPPSVQVGIILGDEADEREGVSK